MKKFYGAAFVALLAVSLAIAWSTLLSGGGPPTVAGPAAVEMRAAVISPVHDFAPAMRSEPTAAPVASRPSHDEHTYSGFPGTSAVWPPSPAAEDTSAPVVADIAARKEPIVMPRPNTDGQPLPVIFRFAKRPAITQDEKALGAFVVEGSLISTSEKTLAITVTETGDNGRDLEQTAFSLGAGVQYRFGVKNGLKMASGGQILIQSPNYQDLAELTP